MDNAFRRRLLLSGCGAGMLGVLVFALLPLFLGEFAGSMGLNDVRTGWLGAAYVAGYTTTTGASFLWIERIRWRNVYLTGTLLMGLGFVICMLWQTYTFSLTGLFFAGTGAGFLYALSCALVSRLEEVDRAFAIKMIPEQGIPALLLFIVPVALVQPFGINGLLALCAAIALIGAFAYRYIPEFEAASELKSGRDSTFRNGSTVAVALLGLLLFFGAISGVWAFAQIIVTDAGIGKVEAGWLLAVGVTASAVGPGFVAIIGDRFGRFLPLLALLVLVSSSLLVLGFELDVAGFAAVLFIFPAAWYAGMAYQMGVIADADVSGRYSVLIAAALGIGATLGPATYGSIRAASDTLTGNFVVVVVAILGVGLTGWAVRRISNRLQVRLDPGV